MFNTTVWYVPCNDCWLFIYIQRHLNMCLVRNYQIHRKVLCFVACYVLCGFHSVDMLSLCDVYGYEWMFSIPHTNDVYKIRNMYDLDLLLNWVSFKITRMKNCPKYCSSKQRYLTRWHRQMQLIDFVMWVFRTERFWLIFGWYNAIVAGIFTLDAC